MRSDADITTRVYAVGGGGGRSEVRGVPGMDMVVVTQGITTFYSGETYLLRVGEGGKGQDGGGWI